MDVERSMLSNGYPPSVASSRRHGTHNTGRSRTSSTARTMSRNVRRLQEAVNLHLNNYEKELFLDALNEYHSQKDSWGFVEILRTILNTPAKQQLVPMIRLVLPPTDIPEFDKCVQLSAAVARGDQAAGRLTNGSSSVAARSGHRPRSSSSHKYSTAPVRLKARPSSSDYNSNSAARELNIIQISPDTDGIGFNIKSGHHGHPGIFVSSVDSRSDAYTQGLGVGDEILEANDIDLSKTSNEDAALILRAARSLTLTVRHCVSSDAHKQETYTWVDTDGRSCSPPPSETDIHNTLRSSVSRRSGMTLISSQDERKINLRIERGHGLGLSIRGGSEYGLGIYITGVDRDSSAKRSGIRVGDQVLGVNDVQCVEITHGDAVKALKRSRHMMLTIKHVGKLPHAKIDKQKLVTSDRARSATVRRSRSQSRRHHSPTEDIHGQSRIRYPGSLDRRKYHEQASPRGTVDQSEETVAPPTKDTAVFTKGAGSQLMLSHSTMMSHHHTSMMSSHGYALVDEQARNLLNDNERGTFKFYIDEYNKSYISVDALVAALKELFNTHAKFQMFHELRELIHPKDVERYDGLVIKYEVASLKNRHDRSHDQMSDFSLDSVLSAHSSSSTNESLTLNLSASQKPQIISTHSNASTFIQNGTESVRSNKMFVTDGSNQTVVTDDGPQAVGSARKRSLVTTAEINHCSSGESSPRDNGKSVPRMGMRAAKISPKVDGRSPSEDSGVDVRAKAGSTSQSGSSYTDTITRSKISIPPAPLASHSDHSDSSDSSLEAVQQQYRHSYSLADSKHADSEDDHIPGLHSDLDTSDHDNVVLVGSKDVGTLPRRKAQEGKVQAPGAKEETVSTPATPTFRQQVQSRSALSGKMYLPPTSSATSQRQEIPLGDTDYDTLDILNISKELYASTLTEQGRGDNSQLSNNNSTQHITASSGDSLPPPPAHLLHDISSNCSTLETNNKVQSSNRDSSGFSHYSTINQLDEIVGMQDDKTAETSSAKDKSSDSEQEQTTDQHPAVAHGRSPKSERKSPRSKSDRNSSIYAVVKKQSPKHARPTMSFEAFQSSADSDSSPTSASAPTIPKKMAVKEEDLASKEEVITVNKLKSTLGLAIEGGAGTKQPILRIINIQETGCAYNSGLKIGHLILRVNDRYLDGLSHNQSARLIADAFRNRKTSHLEFLVRK